MSHGLAHWSGYGPLFESVVAARRIPFRARDFSSESRTVVPASVMVEDSSLLTFYVWKVVTAHRRRKGVSRPVCSGCSWPSDLPRELQRRQPVLPAAARHHWRGLRQRCCRKRLLHAAQTHKRQWSLLVLRIASKTILVAPTVFIGPSDHESRHGLLGLRDSRVSGDSTSSARTSRVVGGARRATGWCSHENPHVLGAAMHHKTALILASPLGNYRRLGTQII